MGTGTFPLGLEVNKSNFHEIKNLISAACCSYQLLGGFHSNPITMSHHYDAGSVQLHQPSHFHHHHHHHHEPRPQPQLPQCQANGCFNPVHCDPSLPEGLHAFAYCSPECRDRHLLPIERVNLTVGLDDMKKKLQEVAAADKRSPSSSVLQRQSSYEHSSRPAGSSSFKGVRRVLGGSAGVNTMYSSSTPVGAGHPTSGVVGSSLILDGAGGGGQHTSRVSSSSSTPFGGAGHVLDMMECVCDFKY